MSLVKDKISVIIVTCNSLPLLRDCLLSLKGATQGYDSQVIVVDNHSADASIAVARELSPGALLISNSVNLGFAAACNQGAAGAQGEYLLFLNPDVILDPESIGKLAAVLAEKGDAGAVAGRLRFPDGTFQPNCRRFPTVPRLLFSRGSFLGRVWRRRSEYTLGDYSETTAVPAVAGTMLMIGRERFLRADGFDERFFMYMEDTDLCYRMSRAGYVHYFVPTAGAVHAWGRGSQAGRVRRNLLHHKSVWRYFRKHYPRSTAIWFLPLLLLFNAIVTVVFPFTQPPRK